MHYPHPKSVDSPTTEPKLIGTGTINEGTEQAGLSLLGGHVHKALERMLIRDGVIIEEPRPVRPSFEGQLHPDVHSRSETLVFMMTDRDDSRETLFCPSQGIILRGIIDDNDEKVRVSQTEE